MAFVAISFSDYLEVQDPRLRVFYWLREVPNFQESSVDTLFWVRSKISKVLMFLTFTIPPLYEAINEKEVVTHDPLY